MLKGLWVCLYVLGLSFAGVPSVYADQFATDGCTAELSLFAPPSELVELAQALKLPIVDVPVEWHKIVLEAYKGAIETFVSSSGGRTEPTLAERVAERLLHGDSSVQSLLELGFTNGQSPKGKSVLVMPAKWNGFINHYLISVLRRVLTGETNLEHTVFPALVFVKRSSTHFFLKFSVEVSEFELVRPYLDPWPDPATYELASGPEAQLSNPVFLHFIRQGKYPFGVGKLFHHEVAHFTEFYSSVPFTNMFVDTIQVPLPNGRGFALAEFMYLPNIGKQRQISQLLLPDFAGLENPPLREQVLEVLERLSPMERAERARRWMAAIDADQGLVLRMGGGARDPYNTNSELKYSRVRLMAEFFRRSGHPERQAVYEKQKGERQYRQVVNENLLGLVEEIAFLIDVQYTAGGVQERMKESPFVEQILAVEAAVREPIWEAMILERLASLETAFAAGLFYRITPEQVLLDGTREKVLRTSASYRYFKSFAVPGSVLWQMFVADEVSE